MSRDAVKVAETAAIGGVVGFLAAGTVLMSGLATGGAAFLLVPALTAKTALGAVGGAAAGAAVQAAKNEFFRADNENGEEKK